MEHLPPGKVFALRVQEARKSRGWTQQELAKQVNAIGYPMSRVTVTKIEKGAERAANASLSEVLAIAAALGVPLVHLLTSRDDSQVLAIAPELTVSAADVRAWIRGLLPLPGGDFGAFFAAMPEQEQLSLMRSHFGRGLDPLGRALMADKITERAEDAAWELTEGNRRRREEQGKDD
jgi:transcriptional regulator with XRE-family HTH domain